MQEKYPPNVTATDHVILYDGVCKLCNGWSRFIIRFDKNHIFKLCSVQSEQGQAILTWFSLPTDHFETMLLVQGNQARTKSDACLNIFQQLPFPFYLLLAFKILPQFCRDWLYDRIALNRYALFGRYDVCILATPDHPQRFLEHSHKMP
jgi:predicted DCC family thiol-disulfide oxidoreductase YuxK